MNPIDPTHYGPAIASLIPADRLMPLGAGKPNQAMQKTLTNFSLDLAFAPHKIRDTDMARACLSGLWLLHNFLDESHTISQSLHTDTGSYWHGLMHRREPDYGNSKYWFHQVAPHPVYEDLVRDAAGLAAEETHPSARFLTQQSTWDPFRFIDLCQACATGRSPCEMLCRRIQQREWDLLFDYCYRHAITQ